jgi:hypothetical protein
LTLVVKLDRTVHTWRYNDRESLVDGQTKPLSDWDLEITPKARNCDQVGLSTPTFPEGCRPGKADLRMPAKDSG